MTSYELVSDRSGGCCEALILMGEYGRWTRCGMRPVEIHHMLTRARGGRILDTAGECYHLMALCHPHHMASDGGEAYEGGLLIDGYVRNENGRPVYYGTDEYLSKAYPRE